MPHSLKKLKELTASLQPPRVSPGYQYYETNGGGKVKTEGLLKEDGCAVQNAVFETEEEFLGHTHDMLEYLIVWKGKGILTMNGEDIELGVGSCIAIPPHTSHSFRAEAGTQVLGITIPAEEAYPDA